MSKGWEYRKPDLVDLSSLFIGCGGHFGFLFGQFHYETKGAFVISEEAIAKTGIRQARLDRDEANKFDILDGLDEVRAPTLVLVGDSFGEWFVNLAKETAKRIKGARFKVLKGGQDPSNLVVPDLFDNEVLKFIRAGNAE